MQLEDNFRFLGTDDLPIKVSLHPEKEQEKQQEWLEGFEAMGRDPDTNDVEYMLPAAWEVMFGS